MSRAVAFIRAWGIQRFAGCVACKVAFRVLSVFFPFDPWHATAPYLCREYKSRVVTLAASVGPRIVADIGCGLGEAVVRISADSRYGFDPDKAAIAAARFLFGARATFGVASVFDAAAIRALVREPELDLLIMTNWTHGVEMEKIRAAITDLAAVLPIRMLLIDTVRPGQIPGALCHDVAELVSLGPVIRSVDGGDGVRDLHLIAVAAGRIG